MNIHLGITLAVFTNTFIQGAIREAGGSFGKKEKAEEDQYFRRQEREQLEKMKKVEADEKAKKKQDGKK
jgi:hypothetical protein